MRGRLLAKPPAERAEPEVAKLATYMSSLPPFVEVPREALLALAREAMHEHHPPGNIVCKQGETGVTAAACQNCCQAKRTDVCEQSCHRRERFMPAGM